MEIQLPSKRKKEKKSQFIVLLATLKMGDLKIFRHYLKIEIQLIVLHAALIMENALELFQYFCSCVVICVDKQNHLNIVWEFYIPTSIFVGNSV